MAFPRNRILRLSGAAIPLHCIEAKKRDPLATQTKICACSSEVASTGLTEILSGDAMNGVCIKGHSEQDNEMRDVKGSVDATKILASPNRTTPGAKGNDRETMEWPSLAPLCAEHNKQLPREDN
ncbi:hypothetical protein JAAARDRAFT_619915 [Jaapia argillacea MUCL 33604]|uniref:Uncharacterized protein n=1 Tax=Jaapia argillacea MUCL 33604 TaxID=933084 RepID=A0A067PX56_9AGAM|nr:hypothetical protein JAAARDRAFT_619915 [Jaapia argillacea MUCL 33604]